MFVGALGTEDSGIMMRDAAIEYLSAIKNLPDFSKPQINLVGLENLKRENKPYN